MNILVINRWVGYNEGGNETQIKDLIKQFLEGGHKVTVITTSGNALDSFGDKVNVKYINSPQKYFSYGLGGVFYALLFNIKSFLAFLRLYLLGERFDIMSIHFSLEALLARVIRFLFGIPYTMILAGDTPLELIEAKRADGRIQISHFMNKQCKKYGYSAEIISKGINLNRYNPKINSHELKKKLGIENKRVILTMCRLDPRKNLITLLEAAKILSLDDVVFVIAGDGVEMDYLIQKTKEYGLEKRVIFVGSIPNTSDEHPMYYSMSELFVLPTLYEGFGWVFLEAMASGVPIVTTNAGSNPEVVGDVGILVPIKNPVELAVQIESVLSNTALHTKLKIAGLEKVQNYAWDEISKKYNNYYENISRNKSSTLPAKLKELVFFFYDGFSIVMSLFKDKVIFNKEGQNYNVTGQKGGLDGNI